MTGHLFLNAVMTALVSLSVNLPRSPPRRGEGKTGGRQKPRPLQEKAENAPPPPCLEQVGDSALSANSRVGLSGSADGAPASFTPVCGGSLRGRPPAVRDHHEHQGKERAAVHAMVAVQG